MAYHIIALVCVIALMQLWFYSIATQIKSSDNAVSKLLTCVLLTLLFKVDWGIHFMGLEYEDSYVFSAYARQLSFDIYSTSFRIDCVEIGSLEEPLMTGSYGGHMIVYPTLLYIVTSIFGFSATCISLSNSIVSFFTMVTIAFIRFPRKGLWIFAVSAFCIAPAVNLYTTAFLSETFSAFISVFFVTTYIDNRGDLHSWFKTILCCFLFSLALLTKRDNAVLFIIPLMDGVWSFVKTRNLKELTRILAPYITVIGLFILFVHNIFEAEIEEVGDIGYSTFSISFFWRQLPVYLASLLTPSYFSVGPILCCLLLANAIYRHNVSFPTASIFIMFCGYVFMYAAHYRGYPYVVGDEEIGCFETFRYLNNAYYCIPIVLGYTSLRRTRRFCILGVSVILLVFSYIITLHLRKEYSSLENKTRLEDVRTIDGKIEGNTIIITDVPLVFLNLAASNTLICNAQLIDYLDMTNPDFKYLLYCSDVKAMDTRYGTHIEDLQVQSQIVLPSGKSLSKVERQRRFQAAQPCKSDDCYIMVLDS